MQEGNHLWSSFLSLLPHLTSHSSPQISESIFLLLCVAWVGEHLFTQLPAEAVPGLADQLEPVSLVATGSLPSVMEKAAVE